MRRNSNRNNPIGVFDSGLGGLTVVKELQRQLPNESIVYFGDTARVPYGIKSKESVIRFSKECVGVLLKYRVKLVIIACNTSSAHALSILKKTFPVPVIGVIQPGARKAVATTRNKRIGVIATQSTINSGAYFRQIKRLNGRIKITGTPCPLFVPLVEEGWFTKKVSAEIAREYLSPVKRSGADTVILGCTHYPLLKPLIQRVMGPKVNLVDSAQEIAREVKEMLGREEKTRTVRKKPAHVFLVSDEPEHFCKLARRFLQSDIKNVKRSRYV